MKTRNRKNECVTSKLISGEKMIRIFDSINAGNRYSENYINPPVPEGYKYVMGEWNNGFVIERCSDGSQFVWIPVGFLDSDGTLDGKHFSEKFGRRNYQKDKFSSEEYYEYLDKELLNQKASIKKYGGFYISRYNISMSREKKPQSIKGEQPCTQFDFVDTKQIASEFEVREDLKSHLIYGCEYDSVLAWFIKSEARTLEEITEDSTDWGNFSNAENSTCSILETGANEKWCTNHIYDFAGNVEEWTQEKYDYNLPVFRGGNYITNGMDYSANNRNFSIPYNYTGKGFRIALYIK